MKEHLISLFIDDELDLDEKIVFVETVYGNLAYKTDAVDILCQEKQLRSEPVRMVPPLVYPKPTQRRFGWLSPLLCGLSCAVLLFILWYGLDSSREMAEQPLLKSHRFIIYRPDISRVEISGSFTGWRPQAMRRIGDSGYWEAEIELPSGEHRFAYVLEGNQRMTDPTIQAREKDDFGGENSILNISL